MHNDRVTNATLAAILAVGSLGAIYWAEAITAPPETGKVIHVVYWEKWTDFERDAMKAVVHEYNRTQGKAKGIFVDFTSVSGIEDKTLVATAGGDPPDIAGLQTIDVAPFADDDALTNLDDYCKEYGIKQADYVPVYWRQVFYRNHVYAMPTTPVSVALHYNKAEFATAGLDPNKPPVTIEELDADAARLSISDGRGGYSRMGFLPAEPGWWNYGWGFFFGGRLWDGVDKITCNSPENIPGVRVDCRLLEKVRHDGSNRVQERPRELLLADKRLSRWKGFDGDTRRLDGQFHP